MRYPTLCVLAERKCAHRGVGAYYGGAPSALSATRAPVQCKSSDDHDLVEGMGGEYVITLSLPCTV